MNSLKKNLAVLGFSLSPLYVYAADNQTELDALKKQLNLLQQQISRLENKINQQQESKSQEPPKTITAAEVSASDTGLERSIKAYATLRPTFGYIDENGETQGDVRDALSHAGFKSVTEFKPGWKAVLHGEWGIDLSNNGDFGKARQVYVALDSPYGKVGIGKQRPVQYLFIAEYIDIFNHGLSPFSYDPESLFFVNNMVTYSKSFNDFTFMAVAQFNGDSGDNYQDLFNTGISYDKGDLHLALTYTKQDALNSADVVGEDFIVGGSFAYQFDMGLYLALGYQDKTYERIGLADRNGHTFDMSMAYALGEQHKLKFGYFDFKDGFEDAQTRDFNGYNLTLEWLPADNLRFHLEYLDKDFAALPDFSSVTFGFRYDYSQLWQY